MKKTTVAQAVAWALVVVMFGTAWGYRRAYSDMLSSQAAAAEEAARAAARQATKPVAQNATAALLEQSAKVAGGSAAPDGAKLQARITDLEKQLSDLRRENRRLEGNQSADGGRGRNRPDWPGAGNADPEARAQFRQRMQEMSGRIQNTVSEQADFFGAFDPNNMTAAQRENHQKLLDALAKIKQQYADMAQAGTDPSSLTPEQRREMFQGMGEVRGLMDTERQYAFADVAKRLNYTAAEAQQFTDYLNYIVQMTTVQGPGRMGGGRPGETAAGGTPAPRAP